MRFKEYILEMLDSKIEFDYDKVDDDAVIGTSLISGRTIIMHAVRDEFSSDEWIFSFGEGESFIISVTGKGGEFKVFSAVKDFLNKFISLEHPSKIIFAANKSEGRINLYSRLIKKYNHADYELKERDDGRYVRFSIEKKRDLF